MVINWISKLKSKDSFKLSINAKIQEGYLLANDRGNPTADLFFCYKPSMDGKGNAQLENGMW